MRDISDVEGVLAIGGSVLMIFVIIFVGLSAGYQHDKNLIAAINDSGCVKPTTIEIKPAVYNAWPNNNGVM